LTKTDLWFNLLSRYFKRGWEMDDQDARKIYVAEIISVFTVDDDDDKRYYRSICRFQERIFHDLLPELPINRALILKDGIIVTKKPEIG